MDLSKRRLISGDWLKQAEESFGVDIHDSSERYFESFDSCYALLATAGPLLIEEARAIGIDTEGKSKEAIAQELFKRGFTHPKDV